MFHHLTIANGFIDTFDKGAVAKLREFLNVHKDIKKWMIAADFSLQRDRPLGCFAFTIFPYDALPQDVERDAVAGLKKDLKKSKNVSSEGIRWLRDIRRFHIVISVNHERAIFVGGDGTEIDQAREFVTKTKNFIEGNKEKFGPEVLKKWQRLVQEAQERNFNVALLSDILLLSIFFSALTAIIGRERPSEMIGWFPDRDNMTTWCDGIWYILAHDFTGQIADHRNIDLRKTRISVGSPDKREGKEIMWFDYLVRSADWFAGAVAEWDRKNDLVGERHPKYQEMWEQVIAGSENSVVLHLDINIEGLQFRRIEVSRKTPEAPAE